MAENLLLLGFPFLQQCKSQQHSAQFEHLLRLMGPLGQTVRQFSVPSLKVGTLDSLMLGSEDLEKVDSVLENTIFKLVSLMEEASQKPRNVVTVVRVSQSQQEMTPAGYLKNFAWNLAQYDTKDSISDLIEKLNMVATGADERVRSLLTEYNDTRNKLTAAVRKGSGSLAVKPIGELIRNWSNANQRNVVNTEMLATLFIAVPVGQQAEWERSYWEMHEHVAPGSSFVVEKDKEFTLNSVVLFRRSLDEFKLSCRKLKYVIRDPGNADDLTAGELRELQKKAEQERNALLIVLSQQYSMSYMAWLHVKALRIFVECLLKYGLPPRFTAVVLAVDAKKEKEIRKKFAEIFDDLSVSPIEDGPVNESEALQQQYPYVSLKVANILHNK